MDSGVLRLLIAGADLFIRGAGAYFVALLAVKVVTAYQSDNETILWKHIFWAFIASVFIFAGSDVIDLFKNTWNSLLGK